MKNIITRYVSILILPLFGACASLGDGSGQVAVQHTVRSVTDTTTLVPMSGGKVPSVQIPQAPVDNGGPRERQVRIAIYNKSSQTLYFYSMAGTQPSGWSDGSYFLPVPVPSPVLTVAPGVLQKINKTIYGAADTMYQLCLRVDSDAGGRCHPVGIPLGRSPRAPLWLLATAFDTGSYGPPAFDQKIVRLAGGGSKKSSSPSASSVAQREGEQTVSICLYGIALGGCNPAPYVPPGGTTFLDKNNELLLGKKGLPQKNVKSQSFVP